MSESPGRTHGVDSARRVLQVLLLFSEDRIELTAEEIAREVSISMPSAYRFIALLREMYLLEEKARGVYALSPRVFALAGSAEQALQISTVVRPFLNHLSELSGEAALLMRRVGDSAMCADMAQIAHPIRLSFAPGHVMDLHRGAGPKVLLSSMGTAWAEEYLERVDPRQLKRERRALLRELETIADRGWAQSSAEVDEGIWAAAAPVKVGSKVIAAISVAGPRYRVDEPSRDRVLHDVLENARQASQKFASWAD